MLWKSAAIQASSKQSILLVVNYRYSLGNGLKGSLRSGKKRSVEREIWRKNLRVASLPSIVSAA